MKLLGDYTDRDWQSLLVFTKNGRINSDERLELLLAELHELEWHIILFSEAHAADGDCRIGDGHRLVTSLGTTPNAGVGILIHSSMASSIKRVYCINGRIMAADIKLLRGIIRVIAVYAPHAGYDRVSEDDILAFYEELYALLIDADR